MTLAPMLADTLKSDRLLQRYCQSADWTFTQKIDGWRKLVVVDDGMVTVLNRRGEKADLPIAVIGEVLQVFRSGRWALDGELLNGVLWVFDLPCAGDVIEPKSPYGKRRQALEQTWELIGGDRPNVRLLPRAETQEAKVALFKGLQERNAEGVILNHVDMPYVPGKRSPYVLKWKFWNDVDCFVTRLRVGGKDNFEVALFRDGAVTIVGEVTAQAGDGGRVQVGDVVCVKYLYTGVNDRLYGPPTIPRIRDDKRPEECTWDQLVYPNKEILV